MDEVLTLAFESLLKKYGSHCQVAKSIGVAPDHYRKIRNGRVNIPQRTADYIILKASEVSHDNAPVVPLVNASTHQDQKSA